MSCRKERLAAKPGLLPPWVGLGLLALTLAALAFLGWRRWPDIFIDFGREIHVPWQLLQGQALYRDLAYFNGPMSPHLNAGWLSLLGVSLSSLMWANLALLAGFILLLHRLFLKATDRVTATCCCLTALIAFALAQLTPVGNYNFLAPYSHELTHGLMLSTVMIAALGRVLQGGGPAWLGLAGLCYGLAALTKAEIMVAASAALLVGLAGLGWMRRTARPRLPLARSLLLLGAAALLPVGLFWGWLALHLPPRQALAGLAGNWAPLWASRVAQNPFYLSISGLDAPWGNLGGTLWSAAGVILLLGGAAAADYAFCRSRRPRLVVAAVLVGLAGLIWWTPSDIPLLLKGRPLPVLTILFGLGLLALWQWPDPMPPPPADATEPPPNPLTSESYFSENRKLKTANWFFLAMWTALALALLAKIFLKATLSTYGFVLALPAALCLVAGCVWLLPGLLARAYGGGRMGRALLAGILLIDLCSYATVSQQYLSRKTFAVGTGPDRILTYDPQEDPRGAGAVEFLAALPQLLPPQATFLALPEGVMLNYLARRPVPLPYYNFMPPDVEIFGETAMLQALKARPPDYVLLVHKDTREFGAAFFGPATGYGQQLLQWVREHYEPVWLTGSDPLQGQNFGLKLLQKK
jgi:hypothetical protein